MWESLNASPGDVALDNEWAKNHGLPAAQPFPWDHSRSIYLLNGHHSLHCIVSLTFDSPVRFLKQTHSRRSFDRERFVGG